MLINSNFRILIVDDIPANLKLLAEILTEQGYQIGFAQNGEEALLAAENLLPDLILLDIMMPILDGYEACVSLKSNQKTAHIPVIFLTAKQDVLDITKAFEIGAADYITKPFNSAELLKRVHTHLLLADQNKKLQLQLKQLESLKKELIENEKIVVIGKLMNGISHGINMPLSAIKYFIDSVSNNNPFFRDKVMFFYQKTTLSEQTIFLRIIQQIVIKNSPKINKGSQLRKELYKELKNQNFNVNESLIDDLIYLNLHNNYQEITPLLSHEKREDIFELIHMFFECKKIM